MHDTFTHRISTRLLAGRAPAVVGLDPRLDALPVAYSEGAAESDTGACSLHDDSADGPAQRIVAFYRDAMPVLAEHAVAVKPNIAFFEVFGAAGYRAYEETCAVARAHDLPVIGDIKRGDIGSTAAAYAEAHCGIADAVTLHPYLGSDSIEPFLAYCRNQGTGAFVLVRTSNPSATEFQELDVGGATLSSRVADAVTRWGEAAGVDEFGYSPVGAVVGATYPAELAALRDRMPRAWLLIPGVGAQGGAVEDLGPAFDERGLGALVNQSRGVMQCFDPDDEDWKAQIERALVEFCESLREVASSR